MTEQAKKSKKRTSFLTMLVIAILIALVGVQLIHLRSQIDDARSQLTALQSDLDTAKQENDALSSALEKAESLEQLRWLENGYRIKVGLVSSETIGIDTPEDLARLLKKMHD